MLRATLRGFFDEVVLVDVLDSNDTENLKLLSRPDLGVTFTKIHCWRLVQYSKCVFMDADTLASVLRLLYSLDVGPGPHFLKAFLRPFSGATKY